MPTPITMFLIYCTVHTVPTFYSTYVLTCLGTTSLIDDCRSMFHTHNPNPHFRTYRFPHPPPPTPRTHARSHVLVFVIDKSRARLIANQGAIRMGHAFLRESGFCHLCWLLVARSHQARHVLGIFPCGVECFLGGLQASKQASKRLL